MPLTCMITRKDLNTVRSSSSSSHRVVLSCGTYAFQVDAYIFISGSCGSLSTTVAFLYVLWSFPRFIRHVKAEGADPTVVVRLATFYQLNVSFLSFAPFGVGRLVLTMRAGVARAGRVPVLIYGAVIDARGRWDPWKETYAEYTSVSALGWGSQIAILIGLSRASTGMVTFVEVIDLYTNISRRFPAHDWRYWLLRLVCNHPPCTSLSALPMPLSHSVLVPLGRHVS